MSEGGVYECGGPLGKETSNMTPLQYIVSIIVAGSSIALLVKIAYNQGLTSGRDLQRVDDIQELWSKMPQRDQKGRFTKRSAT